MKNLFVCSRWDSLCEIGDTDDRVYRTREEAEKRAGRLTYDDDLVSYHVTVNELRPCWKPDDLDVLRDENAELRERYENLRSAMWDRANARAIDFMTEDELRATCCDLFDYIDELKALVRDCLAHHIDVSCAECEIRDECHDREDGWRDCLYDTRIRERAYELGIEMKS